MEKLKFIFISLYLSLYGAPEVDVSIEHALTTVHGNQTIVVIGYSGSDAISYVKNINEQGVVTVDFPGVFSNVDFESLEIPQVIGTQQLTLNPDANQGISLRFQLESESTFSIYESEAQELTFIFEGSIPQPEQLALAKIDMSSPPSIPMSDDGYYRITQVLLKTDESGGLVVTDCGSATFSTFKLEEPSRFVVDFKDTILATTTNDYIVELEMVDRIRVRQFRTDPRPITRMVLDLNKEVVSKVLKTADGLSIAFARTEAELANLIDQATFEGSAQSKNRAFEKAGSFSEANKDSETDFVELEDSVVETSFEQTILGEQAPFLDQGFVSPEKPWDLQSYLVVSNSESNSQVGIDTESVITGEVSKQADPEVLTPVIKAAPIVHAASFEVTEEVADISNRQVVEMEPEFEVTNVAEVEPPFVAIQNSYATGDVTLETKRSSAAATTSSNSDDSLDMVIRGETEVEETSTFVAVHKKSQDPTIEMANDIDLELDAFLDESEDQPLHKVMKDVPRNKKRLAAPLVITNEAMALYAGRQLVEAAATQESGQEDFESLFNEDSGIDSYETIDGGQQQYNGFEISSINVRSVSVIDLLRFIADLVGINLYVDSSVSEELRATYKFTNLPWDQVLDIILKNAGLEKEFTNGVLRVATVSKFQQEAQARAELRLQRELSVPPQTVTFPLSYAKVSEAKPIIESYLSPRGRILIDERTNTLIIEDIPKRMVAIRELIRKLDRIIDQVTIEARIVETNKRFLRELGIQWGLGAQYSPEMGTDTGVTFPNRVNVGGPARGTQIATGPIDGGYAVNFPIVSENPSGFGLTLGNFLDNFKLDISLQMLETDGNGQIISSPKITTQNNKTAIIKNGSRIPVQTVQRGTITIVYIDAVLELEVTPHITSEETIIMDLVIDKSEPDFTRTVSGNPVINVRRAETRVLVKNGGTAVIGGIFSLNEQEASQGLPGVRRIPVLKRLFGSESKSYSNEELLIFITPRIVKY